MAVSKERVLAFQSAKAKDIAPSRLTTVMATTTASGGQAHKARVALTLDDILSDLDKIPLPAESVQSSTSPSSQYTRQPLPDSSESVDTSIELSQRFIESSKRVLKDTEALDAVRSGLERVDHLLEEIEQAVRP